MKRKYLKWYVLAALVALAVVYLAVPQVRDYVGQIASVLGSANVDAVVEFITPIAATSATKAEAVAAINDNLAAIEEVCDEVLRENGYYYGANAEVRSESFPTRVYGDLTLESGEYDALIIELGAGSGDNWWCVLYPPLCFTSASQDVTYRSLIYDIISGFFAK